MQALSVHGADAWLQAAQAIPHKIRTMYMHAVQSFVWNNVASARLRMHGRQVIVGDLVIAGGVWPDGGSAESPLKLNACTGGPVAEGAGSDGNGNVNTDRKRLKADAAGTAPGRTARARMGSVAVVTSEDVAKGRYSIEDVVLPLPGSEVQYPAWPRGARLGQCCVTDCRLSTLEMCLSAAGTYMLLWHMHVYEAGVRSSDCPGSQVCIVQAMIISRCT